MNQQRATQPVEIEDNVQLALDVGVDDESADESANVSFSITSYGADYPVDTLVKRMKGEAFFIPTFQRNFVWSQKHASRFIESLLMGLPVPGIFLYKEAETGRHLVVDGQQRLRTLQYFYTGLFQERSFRLIGVSQQWEGKLYTDLETSDQLKLDDSIVHATVFQQDEPKEAIKSLYFVFERINSGGIRLSSQEIRNCISDSAVLQLAGELNEDPNWRKVFGEQRNNRLKDQELVLRAVAMIHMRSSYKAPMRDFLNDFAADKSKSYTPAILKELGDLFSASMKAIFDALGKAAFRPVRALNAAVFEAVTVGVAERLRSKDEAPSLEKLASEYDKLLLDPEFQKATERATATEESVKTRQRLAITAFSDI